MRDEGMYKPMSSALNELYVMGVRGIKVQMYEVF